MERQAVLELKSRQFKVFQETDRPDIVIVEQIKELQTRPIYDFVKRGMDIIASLFALLILFVPMLIIAICIRIDSPGNAIYVQERLGRNGKPFNMYKFRSMSQDAEKGGAQWAEKDDSRVTRIGRILRKTRMDELPQFLNILLGHMSLAGPRPERAVFYEQFEQYIVGFSQRMLVKPGLTGHAQVNGGYELLPEEKIAYDISYIKERSIVFDIKCILKTAMIVFRREGAR